jgi:plastocyanin
MKRWLALLLVCLSLGLVATGCGDDDDDSGGGAAETTEQPAETGGAEDEVEDTGAGGAVSVGMESIQFDPEAVTVKAGDTITFENKESVPHDVFKTAGPGPQFESGPEGGMQQGDTFDLTLEEPGKYEYVCRVHAPGMSGTITVK